ncbi:hypothetical protein JTL98_35600, partial [Pseudomonas aeruginosa]|nr:hypothetical protein [Pseudomonas aeruginosa]
SVVDRTGTRLLGRARIPSSAYSDPEQLAGLLQQAREELSHNGYNLQDWSMPSQGSAAPYDERRPWAPFSFPLFEAVVLPERHAHRVAPCILGLV